MSGTLKDLLEIKEEPQTAFQALEGMSFIIEGHDMRTLNEQRALFDLPPLDGMRLTDTAPLGNPPHPVHAYELAKKIAEQRGIPQDQVAIDRLKVLHWLDEDPEFKTWKHKVLHASKFIRETRFWGMPKGRQDMGS